MVQMEMGAECPVIDNIVVRKYEEADEAAWDHFVREHPQGSPFHLSAWRKTIEESFGYRSIYLLAERGGQICAVLPLFLVRNLIVKSALISTPFAVYGGILAESREALVGLHDYAVSLGRTMGVRYIELRNSHPEQCVIGSNVSRYVAFSQELVPGEQELLESLPKKMRNMVRKALKQPFETRFDVGDVRTLDSIHSRNMHRLGTPNFPRRYFERLLTNFGEMADVREVWLDGKPLAVSLNLYFRGEMHTYHAAADSRYNALAPNTFMYFDHLRWAGQNGYTSFDFGRCKRGTGVFEFKKHWNTTMRELPYEIVLVRATRLPNLSPANPKFHLPIEIWKRLPEPFTRAVSRLALPLFP